MSQKPQPTFHKPLYPYPAEPSKENGFGLAGFIVSIVALFLCGIPSVIGILISLIGLRKKPKGFAVAGLIIGLLGLLEIAILSVLAVSAYQVGQQVSQQIGKSSGTFLQEFPVMMQLHQESQAIGEQWERRSRLPTQTEGEELLKGKRDPMGNQLVYETDGESFSLRTAGADGTLETDDDIVVGPFMDVESTRVWADQDEFGFAEGKFDASKLEELIEAEMKKD